MLHGPSSIRICCQAQQQSHFREILFAMIFYSKPSQLIEIAELMAKEHSPSRKNIYEVILLTQPFLILVVTSDVSGCGQNGQPVLRERVLSWHRTVLQLIQEAIAANWRHNHLLKSLSLVCPILLSLRQRGPIHNFVASYNKIGHAFLHKFQGNPKELPQYLSSIEEKSDFCPSTQKKRPPKDNSFTFH